MSVKFQNSEITASNGNANDGFGVSVFVYGNTVAVGASNYATAQGAVYLFDITNISAPVQKAFIQASDKTVNNNFGASLSIYGNTLVVGAPGFSGGTGKVYFFDITNLSAPVERSNVVGSDSGLGDTFGTSVSVYKNTAVVGSPLAVVTGGVAGPGKAYIFDITNLSAPVQKSTVVAADGVNNDEFGFSVFVYKNIVVVGAPFHQVGSNGAQGKSYLFDVTSLASPVTKGTLVASGGTAAALFGWWVSIYGNVVAVAAPQAGPKKYGAVYIFDATNLSTPVQASSFTAPDSNITETFGHGGVSIYGTTVAVGSDRNTVTQQGQGEAYLFDVTNIFVPTLKAILISSDGGVNSNGDSFGTSVSVYGNVAIIGAEHKPVNGNAFQGSAYLYANVGAVSHYVGGQTISY